MSILEIIVIIIAVLIVLSVIFTSFMKKKKGGSTCGSGCCGCPLHSSCESKKKSND